MEQRRSEALRPVYLSLAAALGAFAVSILVAIAASFVLARRLATPILALREGAARIGSGDLSARIEADTGDEIALLADDFNRMASRLGESYESLERRVAERTAELAMRRQEADAANAAKTRFLAAASHDLRQPMHAISLLVGLLHDRVRSASERELVEKVQDSVQAMENLFSGLLDISKLDAGAVRPNNVPFEIGAVLRHVALHGAPSARAKGLEFRVVPSRTVVVSDPVLLERILSNLVTNAIRYTDRGKVLVGCRRAGNALRVLVCDTGIGIAPEYRDEIFEEFFQVRHTERDRSQGLGLGLSIVKRTARLLGHELVVRSVPGKGSIFGVVVPRTHPSAGGPSDATGGPTAVLEGIFAVVINDEKESRFAMELLLRQWGCHVVTARSGEEAIELLANHLRTPDLIVSDYRLGGGLSGLSAIRRIREQCEQDVPAIILTGDVSAEDLQTLEGVVVLYKPVNVERLRAAAAELARSQAAL